MKHTQLINRDESRKLEVSELPLLHRAAAEGRLLEIARLLDAGEDIDTPLPFQAAQETPDSATFYFEGCSPLHLSTWFGKVKAVDLLLDRGANIVAHDAGKAEALLYAICGCDPGIAVRLLARGQILELLTATANATSGSCRMWIHMADSPTYLAWCRCRCSVQLREYSTS
jgi:ankyrin repeat protein